MIRVRLTVRGKVESEVDADRELVVGRKAPADLVIADGQVSSRHVRLKPDGDRLLVADLGSTNGTHIDSGDRLVPNVDVPLAPGQKLLVGPAVIEVVAGKAQDSGAGLLKQENTVLVGAGAMQSLLVDIAKFKAAQPRIIVGAEHHKGAIEMSEMEVIVGREAPAQVVISHGSVSTEHARLTFSGGRFHVEDLGSSNGTFVGPTRISGKSVLEPQTSVTFGTVECLFVAKAPEAGGAEGAADPHAEILCAHAVHLGKATDVQSREVLAEHRTTGKTLGEIFVVKGIFTPREWAEVYRHRATIATLRPTTAPRSASRTLGLVVILVGIGALLAVAFIRGWFGGGK